MELKETGKRNKLFISHCSEIDQTASEIAEYFEAEGIACWIDHRDISSGKNYMEVIKRAISNECFGAIFLLEEHAVKSIQIKQELSLSNGEQKRGFLIYPLYLANVNAEDMDYVFTNKQKTNAPDPRFPWHELEKEQLQELRSTVFADYEALQNNNDRCGSRNSANVSMAQNQEVFRELREGIRRFYAAEHQAETELCNSELIIPKVREFDHWLGLDEPISFEESVKALWKQKDWNCLYIGKGGSGKTSCLYQLMKDFINSYPEKLVFYVRIEECLSYGASGIARYIEKNYIRRFDRMCSLYEIKNMLYNFDFRKEKEPRIILMLDGLSECSGKDCTTLQEELDRIRINKSIQLLMTSSGISQPFYIGSAAVQRFQIQELSEKQIDSYLTLNHCMPDTRQKIPYNIVSNPLMLTIYANTNTFIRKGTDQTEFPCYFREEISSDADILWNYLEMTVHRYSGKRVCEESLKRSFLLKFILPYIAACMEVNTSSSHKDLDEIHSYVALDNPKMFTQNEFFRCVERAVEMLKENAFLNVFSEFDTERWTISYSREECKRILEHDLMRKPELLYKNGYGRYCFCSTVFAKFLAAVHFYHYLKVRNSVKERASDLEIPQFSSEVSVYLGELCEEQKNRPYKDEEADIWYHLIAYGVRTNQKMFHQFQLPELRKELTRSTSKEERLEKLGEVFCIKFHECESFFQKVEGGETLKSYAFQKIYNAVREHQNIHELRINGVELFCEEELLYKIRVLNTLHGIMDFRGSKWSWMRKFLRKVNESCKSGTEEQIRKITYQILLNMIMGNVQMVQELMEEIELNHEYVKGYLEKIKINEQKTEMLRNLIMSFKEELPRMNEFSYTNSILKKNRIEFCLKGKPVPGNLEMIYEYFRGFNCRGRKKEE